MSRALFYILTILHQSGIVHDPMHCIWIRILKLAQFGSGSRPQFGSGKGSLLIKLNHHFWRNFFYNMYPLKTSFSKLYKKMSQEAWKEIWIGMVNFCPSVKPLSPICPFKIFFKNEKKIKITVKKQLTFVGPIRSRQDWMAFSLAVKMAVNFLAILQTYLSHY